MRSPWKPLYIHTILYRFLKSDQPEYGISWLNQKLNLRSSVITTSLKNKSFFLHDGMKFIRMKLTTLQLLNIKLGQFTINRKFPKHSLYSVERIKAHRLILIHKGVIKSKRKRAIWKKYIGII